MKYNFAMVIFVSISASVMLVLSSFYNGGIAQNIIKKDTAKQDFTKQEKRFLILDQNNQFSFGRVEKTIVPTYTLEEQRALLLRKN